MQTIEHPYKPRRGPALLALLFFAACGAFAAHEAIGNDRGLILNGVIRLEVEGATRFYWTIAALSAVFVLIAIAMLAAGLTGTASLRLSATELSAPRSAFSRSSTVVRRADIAGVDVMTVNKQRFLHVHHPGGTLTILQSCLPSDVAFDEVCSALRAR